MNEYQIFISSKELSSSLNKGLDNLKNDDSVIRKEDTIKVVGISPDEADVLVLIGDAAEDTLSLAQTNSKPVLLCDIDCSKFEKPNSDAIPFTWGLFSKKEKEKTFLKYYNLSFVYDAENENIMDYIAPIVFSMLEEFVFHSKYNKDFGHKKQAEFIHEFTQFYLDKMKQLVEAEGFVREDIKGDFNHIIYRYRPNDMEKPFKSIDGRDYDFIIEYHRGKPSEGIYYGIKGEVTSGDLEKQCEKFREEWPNIFMKTHEDRENCLTGLQKATTDILNDTFLWKDFLSCYKPTDNFNKKRYWLFWITLNDDESTNCVAALAVKLISRTYEEYLWKGNEFMDRENQKKNGRGRPVEWGKKDNYLRIPYFSNEAYSLLCESYGSKDIIECWISSLEENGIIHRDDMYEMCYRLNIDAKVFIFDYVRNSDNEHDIKSPFNKKKEDQSIYYFDLLDRLFLPEDSNKSVGYFRQLRKKEH